MIDWYILCIIFLIAYHNFSIATVTNGTLCSNRPKIFPLHAFSYSQKREGLRKKNRRRTKRRTWNPRQQEHCSHWKLFCTSILRCVFAWEFEVFQRVQPLLRKTAILLKTDAHWQERCFLKNMFLFLRYWGAWFLIRWKNSEYPCRLGILVKIYLFFCNTEVLLRCICFLF